MVWLRAEMDGQDKSLVSTLWCVVCRQYETRICGYKNFSMAWIDGSNIRPPKLNSQFIVSNFYKKHAGGRSFFIIHCDFSLSLQCKIWPRPLTYKSSAQACAAMQVKFHTCFNDKYE